MKNIFKSALLALTLLCVPAVTVAAEINCASAIGAIHNMDEISKRALIVQCEQTKLEAQKKIVTEAVADNTPTSEKVLNTMDRVSNIAKQFAEAIGIAAKELGVAVNEFITTPAGIITILFIVYQMAGNTIIYILLAGFALTFIMNRLTQFIRTVLVEDYETETYKNFLGQEKTRKVPKFTPWKNLYDGQAFWVIVVPIIECVVVLLVILNIPGV